MNNAAKLGFLLERILKKRQLFLHINEYGYGSIIPLWHFGMGY